MPLFIFAYPTRGASRYYEGMSTPPRSAGTTLRILTIFLGASILILGWRAWEPIGRDQSIFYVLGREMCHLRLPYRDLFEHKPPGCFLFYAVAYLLDGGAGWAIGLMDSLVAGATAGLIAITFTRLGPRHLGVWAGCVYLLTSRAPVFGGFWATGQPEVFQDLFVAAALLLASRGFWAWSGAMVAMVLTLKFTYIALLPVFLFWGGRKVALRFLAGCALPVISIVLLMAVMGALGPAWNAVVLFNMRHSQVDSVPWSQLPSVGFAFLSTFAKWLPAPWIAGVLGLVLLARRPSAIGWPRWLVPALFLAACAQLIVQRKLWNWHWEPLMLPLAMGAAATAAHLAKRSRVLGFVVMGLLLLPTVVLSSRGVGRRFSAGNEQQVLARYTWGGNDFSALEVAQIGEAIRSHARPGDRMLIWGFEPGVYLSSGLQPGSHWLYDYPLYVLPGPDRDRAVDGILSVLPRTRWWLVFRNDQNSLEALDSRSQLERIPKLNAAWQRDYRAVGRVGDVDVFERQTSGHP